MSKSIRTIGSESKSGMYFVILFEVTTRHIYTADEDKHRNELKQETAHLLKRQGFFVQKFQEAIDGNTNSF